MVATTVKLIAKPLTLEQFLQMPETEPTSEYIDNEITKKICQKDGTVDYRANFAKKLI